MHAWTGKGRKTVLNAVEAAHAALETVLDLRSVSVRQQQVVSSSESTAQPGPQLKTAY